METRSYQPEVSYFHCPERLCSSISVIADVDGRTAKLLCTIPHVFWVPISSLKRVFPYWPSKAEGELTSDAAERS